MCGIVGYAGTEQAAPVLLDGLSRLEYRGYDSAGIAVFSQRENRLNVHKAKGRLKVLDSLLRGGAAVEGTTGVGHTRWATHGAPSDENSHPQVSLSGKIAVVHNGIIENYGELKAFLQEQGVLFTSETDTEVVAQLVEYFQRDGADILTAVGRCLRRIEGSYALGILSADTPGQIIAARKDSPLILGYGSGCSFLASDVTAILRHTRNVSYMEDGETAFPISPATTAKPFPASPARAASILAFNANRLVCAVIVIIFSVRRLISSTDLDCSIFAFTEALISSA